MIQYMEINPESENIEFEKTQIQIHSFFNTLNTSISILNKINELTDMKDFVKLSEQLTQTMHNMYAILSTTTIVTPIAQNDDKFAETIPFNKLTNQILYKIPMSQIMWEKLINEHPDTDFNIIFGKITLLEFFRSIAPISHYVPQVSIQFVGIPDIVHPEDKSKYQDTSIDYTKFLHQIANFLPNHPDKLSYDNTKKLTELFHIWRHSVLANVDTIRVKLYHGTIEDNLAIFITTTDGQPLDNETLTTLVERIGKTTQTSIILGDDSRLPEQQAQDRFIQTLYTKE